MEIEYLTIDTKVICYIAFAWAVTSIAKALLKVIGSDDNNKKGKK